MAPYDSAEARAKMRLGAAMGRRNTTRRQVMNRPPPMPSPGALPPAAANRLQLLGGGGDDWGVGGLVHGPRDWVQDKLGPTAMSAIKQVGPLDPIMGPAYQAASRIPKVGPAVQNAFADTMTDPYTYAGGFGGGEAVAASKGLGFIERILSKIPSVKFATTDRGPVDPLVQSMLSGAGDMREFGGINPAGNTPGSRFPRFPGGPLDPENRGALEDLVHGYGGEDQPWVYGMNEEGDDVPMVFAQDPRGVHPTRQPDSMPPDERDWLHSMIQETPNDPDMWDSLRFGEGLAPPTVNDFPEPGDYLARMVAEHFGGTRPVKIRGVGPGQPDNEISLQGSALGPLAALGAYGMQRRQQQRPRMNQALQQALRRRMPLYR